MVGVSNADGAIESEAGIDAHALQRHVAAGGALAEFGGVEAIAPDDLLGLDCDVLIPLRSAG